MSVQILRENKFLSNSTWMWSPMPRGTRKILPMLVSVGTRFSVILPAYETLLITSSCFILRSLRPNNLIWNNFTPFHASQKYQFRLLKIWHHDLDFVLVIITACLRPAPPPPACPRLSERRRRLKFRLPLPPPPPEVPFPTFHRTVTASINSARTEIKLLVWRIKKRFNFNFRTCITQHLAISASLLSIILANLGVNQLSFS